MLCAVGGIRPIALFVISALVWAGCSSSLDHVDLKPVCDGEGLEEAASLAAATAPRAVAGFAEEESGWSGPKQLFIPEGWDIIDGNSTSDTPLVLCMERLRSELVVTCPYNQGDTEWVVDVYDVDYALTLRAAATAEILDEAELSTENGNCPIISVYRESDPNPKPRYETDIEGLEDFLSPHVLG